MSLNPDPDINVFRGSGPVSDLLFFSPPMLIGQHEWIVAVYRGRDYDDEEVRYCDYAWRQAYNPFNDWNPWMNAKKWPKYDFNDGTYGGLPKTLQKLYARHKPAIERAIGEFSYEEREKNAVEGA